MSTSLLSRITDRIIHPQPGRGLAPGRARWKLTAAALGVALAATSAAAAIVATAPAFVQVVAPASVAPGALSSNVNLFAFNERQCFPVPAGGLATDGGVIPAGTRVSSHFLHGDAVTTLLLDGQVLFNGPILGVISTSAGLDASDATCGLPATVYPTGFGPRGLEAGQADAYAIIAGGFGIAARMQVPPPPASFLDQIRVITRCCPNGPGGACPGAPGGLPD